MFYITVFQVSFEIRLLTVAGDIETEEIVSEMPDYSNITVETSGRATVTSAIQIILWIQNKVQTAEAYASAVCI